MFYSLLDSNHGDIGEQRTGMTLQQLAAECSGLSNCQSFNTQGYLKLAVKTIDLFQRLTGDPCKGLYVKESIPGKWRFSTCGWVCQQVDRSVVANKLREPCWCSLPICHPNWIQVRATVELLSA